MRVLTVHAVSVHLDPHVEDCLLALVGVRRGDEATLDATVVAAAREVRDRADHLSRDTVVVAGCPALTDAPAATDVQVAAVDGVADTLDDLVVRRSEAAPGFEPRTHPHAVRAATVRPARPGPSDGRWEAGRGDPSDRPGEDDAVVRRERLAPGRVLRDAGVVTERGHWRPHGTLLRELVDRTVGRAFEGGPTPVAAADPADSLSVVRGFDLEPGQRLSARTASGGGAFPSGDGSDSSTGGGPRRELHGVAPSVSDATEELVGQGECLRAALDGLGLEATPLLRVRVGDERSNALASAVDAGAVHVAAGHPWPVEVAFVVPVDGGVVECAAVAVDADGPRRAGLGDVVHVHGVLDATALVAALVGRTAVLPPALAPVQVRVVPVGPTDVERSLAVADRLSPAVSVDVDDRPTTVGARLADAETELVDRVVVIGPGDGTAEPDADADENADALSVTDPRTGDQALLTLAGLRGRYESEKGETRVRPPRRRSLWPNVRERT